MLAACVERGLLRQAAVHLVALAGDAAFSSSWPSAAVMVVLRSAPAPGDGERVAAFAAHHRLTSAETRVLVLLVEGCELPAIGERLGVAYSTVRSHVRMLLGKTGSVRQADLLRLVRAS
jgi:DNA-binding CsgD family transcriptional regulator